jgi:hypothetical protein
MNFQSCDDRYYLTCDMSRGMELLRQCIGGSAPDDASFVSDMDAVGDDELEGEDGAVSESEKVLFWRAMDERGNLSFSKYRKHYNHTTGNIHAGTIHMNPIVDNAEDEFRNQTHVDERDFINLGHSGRCHILSGHIYESFLRTEEMAQTRRNRKEVLKLLPHATNLCLNGFHLPGDDVKRSMEEVCKVFPLLEQNFEHRLERRQSQNSNNLRLELMCGYNMENDSGTTQCMLHMPNVDPTDFIVVYHKAEIDAFEERFVATHLGAVSGIVRSIRSCLENNRITNFEGEMSAAAKVQFLASSELLVSSVETGAGLGAIQKLMYREEYDGLESMDIPVSLRVPLSEEERERTGLAYGVTSELFSLNDTRYAAPPRYLSSPRVSEGYLSNLFPKQYNHFDRHMIRLMNGRVPVGLLVSGKGLIKEIIHDTIREVKDEVSTDVRRNRVRYGVMDVPEYGYFLRSSGEHRAKMFEAIGRVLIICYCQMMHKELVNGKVFGENHGLLSDDNEDEGLSLALKDFPFVKEKVQAYKEVIQDTKFVEKAGEIRKQGNVSYVVVVGVFFNACLYLTYFVVVVVADLIGHLFRGSGSSGEARLGNCGRGWKNFVPRLLYRYCCDEVLPVWHNLMTQDSDFDVNGIRWKDGLDPFSVEEFDELVAEAYVGFVSCGDENKTPIVYHTTVSQRIREPGHYHIVRLGVPELEGIPDPVAAPDDGVATGRQAPQVFWQYMGTHTVFEVNGRDSYNLSIGQLLVGGVLLKNCPDLVNDQPPVVRKPWIHGLFSMNVTPIHMLGQFFPSIKFFEDYVKNIIKKFFVPSRPSHPNSSDPIVCHRAGLCQQFLILGMDGDFLDAESETLIDEAMSG